MAELDGMSVINSHIEKGEYTGVYLLGGEEKYLLAQYKEKLINALISPDDTMNYAVYKSDNANADQIIDFASTMPFFADRRVALIEDSDFFKKGNEDIEKLIEELPETTVLIFVENNIDKRSRLYKLVSKNQTVAMFGTPDEKTLLIWLKSQFTKENINITDNAVYRLLECVGADMNNLANEAEKLKCYCLEKDKVEISDVEELCINQIESKIFEMMDALSVRNKKKTIDLYNDLLLLKEPAMRILFLITRQFNILLKTKLAVENGYEYGKIASAIKVPPFTVKKYVQACNGYTKEQLLTCVDACMEADTSIKTGLMKDVMAVEMLIVRLLNN